MRISFFHFAFFILHFSVNAIAGETLYNGIVLPDEWPPIYKEFPNDPMPLPYLEKRPDVVPIDIGRQLFIDDFLIEKTNLKRTYHRATYHPDSPVVKPDKPWETGVGRPTTMVFSDGVWYDPADKIFKMWYMAGYVKSTAYATSKDGIHWEKPTLDVIPGTNVVMEGHRDSVIIWLDLNEKDPARRYKLLRMFKDTGWKPALYFSADGIHWGGEPLTGPILNGDRTTMFFNPFRNLRIYSLRWVDPKLDRTRHYLECADLVEALPRLAKDSKLWTNADRLDPRNPNEALKDVIPQLYNLDAVAYESIVLGLFSIWQGDPPDGTEKRNEVLLGFSRDGFHWDRPDRKPFIGVNETPGAWNYSNIQTAGGGCLVVGDHLYFYVSGRGKTRGVEPCGTGLAILRRDGFASMDASGTEGVLTTRPIKFKGKYLFVNADVKGGELRAEVLDRDGKVIAPFTRESCRPISADKTLQALRWSGASDLSTVTDKPVRFRFHVKNGSLYSFWVSPNETGASMGYVAAGGPGFTEHRDTTGLEAYKAAKEIASTQPQ